MGIKNIFEKIYLKLNPGFHHLRAIRLDMDKMEGRMDYLESLLEKSVRRDDPAAPSEKVLYRYLYLRKYIKGDEKLLDIEGLFGAGAKILYENTMMGSALCLNANEYYTDLGRAYLADTNVEFKTGTLFEINDKFDIILAMNEAAGPAVIGEAFLKKVSDSLEKGGIFGLALKGKDYRGMPDKFEDMVLIEKLSQPYESADLLPQELAGSIPDKNSVILFYQKRA